MDKRQALLLEIEVREAVFGSQFTQFKYDHKIVTKNFIQQGPQDCCTALVESQYGI